MFQVIAYPTNFAVTEVQVDKGKISAKVGITLKNATREAGIAIAGLTEASPLQGSFIRSKGGQVLLAVNGDPNIPDVAAAATLLGKSQRLSLLVCEQHQHYNSPNSCIQIVAAPFFKHNPGVCFSSTRGRTLVTISKIFKGGPFAGNRYLGQGDIVLAVNGIPVSKPEDADRALHSPVADGSVAVLHVVDIHYLRALTFGAIDNKIVIKRDKHSPEKYVIMAQRSGGSTTPLPVKHDAETQHLYDPSPYQKLIAQSEGSSWDFKNPKGFFKGWYQRVVSFIERYNELLDQALDPLEDLACEYSWRHNRERFKQSGSPPVTPNALPTTVAVSNPSTPARRKSSPPQPPPALMIQDSDVYVPPQPKTPIHSPKAQPKVVEGDFIAC